VVLNEVRHVLTSLPTLNETVSKAVVQCQNNIILKNFRPEPLPSVDRPNFFLFQAWFHYEMK